ncbi:bifunctional 4-hydroxy-2-oxoglutarate aldolase/2-dehydro-3-deoxy-phosphogluconate aldolase [Flavitalea flava]
MGRSFSWKAFNTIPVVGILRNIPLARATGLAGPYCESGMTTLEITMNSPDAAATLAALVKTFGDRLNIGAGTVCNKTDLEKALDAGAQFIVTPILDKRVIKTCLRKKIPVFPGAYTPTEIYKAWSLGADMVKVFPATDLGPGFIKEVLAPLNRLSLLPTGGVTPGNFIDFFKAGAKGVGMGSHLFPIQMIEKESWAEMGALFSSLVNTYRNFQLNGKS